MYKNKYKTLLGIMCRYLDANKVMETCHRRIDESNFRTTILTSLKQTYGIWALTCIFTVSGFAGESGLFAHWPMNEGSGKVIADVTGNGHSGTLKNGVSWGSGSGLTFDGVNDYVNVGTLNVSGNALSIVAWFRSDDLANCSSKHHDCRIISKATGVAEEDHYLMVSTIKSGDNTRLRFRLKTNGKTKTLVASSGNIVENKWVHIAAVYDGATMRLYKDGIEVGKTSKSGAITNKSGISCWIGGNPPNSTSRPWDGQINDVRIYSRAVGVEEIRKLANGDDGEDVTTVSTAENPAPASEEKGLVAYWPVDEGSGKVIGDISGNGNTGTLKNGPSWGAGSGLKFDGVNDYVDVGSIEITGKAMTLSAWFWSDDLANCSSKYHDCRIISKATGTTEQDHYFMVSTIKKGSNTRLRFRLKTNGTTKTLIASSGNIVENQWVHVAAVYDGASMRLYKDGVEVGKTSKSGTITNKSGVSCWIGGNPPSATARPWDGQIDDVAIYSRALTVKEIQELALLDEIPSSNSPPPSSNQAPRALIEADATSGTTPLTVQFDGSGSSDPDGTIASYKWNFANGLSSSSVSPKHVFDTEGSYQVTLTVTDNDGATDKATKTITVTSPTPSNQLPVAKNDDASTQVDSEVSINVLSNDYDADGDDLTITDVTLPSNGIADFDDTTAYYTPNAGFTGTDRFDYMINDGFGGTASATVFITILSNGTGGQSQCNDGIDNDGDGLVDWQYDLGCYGATDNTEGNAATVALDNGWTVFETSGDSLIIYVSNSKGNDSNDGLSPSKPVKTITKGASLVRHGYHDFLLLKRGDTWTSSGLGKFKSGKDKDHPIVIASYGNSTKRPHVKLLDTFIGHSSQSRSHIALVGLSLIASKMDPQDSNFQGSSVVRGLRLVGGGSNILIEDNKFRYMQLTIQSHNGYQYKNISLRRNIVLDAWAPNSTNSKSGKAQGLYASGIRNGLLIEENTFDHNGWNEEVAGAGAGMYGHNIYLQKGQDGKNTVVRGNIFTRAASHGLQGRSGGLFEDNLFVQNTYGLLIGGTDPLPSGTTGYARDNVILEGKRMDPNDDTIPQTAAVVGLGIGNTDVGTLKVEGNIVANRIESGINKGIKDQPGAIYVDNIQYDWGGGIGDMTNPGWLDPERSVGSYHATLGKKGTLEGFLAVIRNRPFGQWPQAYSAYAVNDYIATGFNR